ncbi:MULTISPECIES: helix-turn-helix transcriptional regulator [Roseovarius]|uniref:helix-turn-helix transcriptional regulator n=1 Tax=Roseovarius TaxID=74030 RepID=UPI000CDD617B|nr:MULTISPECIES: helix-turn-helix domain-containing protein [Roseovarius]
MTGQIPSHLTQHDLAFRWRVSRRTLERWRAQGRGPDWLKICGRVLYRRSDVEAFEEAGRRQRDPQ